MSTTILKCGNASGTYLKVTNEQSTAPSNEDKLFVPYDTQIELTEVYPLDNKNHYKVTLKEPENNSIDYFLYSLHWVVVSTDDVDIKANDPKSVVKQTVKPASFVIKEDKYKVKFTFPLGHSDSLIVGKLEFIKNDVVYNTVQCTSSLPGRQYSGSWNRRGGLIPPTSMVKNKTGAGLTVKTDPIFMPNVTGVSGNFYQIFPFEMETDRDTRGDWGIHRDANTPGSMGCIVAVTQLGWQAVQREFRQLSGIGIRSVELVVIYI